MQQPSMGGATKNDKWITEEHAEDPAVLPHIPGFHILVRPISVKEKTKGGLYLPDSVQNDISYLTTVGKVLVVGAGVAAQSVQTHMVKYVRKSCGSFLVFSFFPLSRPFFLLPKRVFSRNW